MLSYQWPEMGLYYLRQKVYMKQLFQKGVVINSVGAGDSLVAGFVGRYEQTKDIEKAFQYGVATGSATAFSADLCEKGKSRRIIVASNCN